MKDFSQSGEQKIILDYFQPEDSPTFKIGRVLDIGANDGETFSMSRALVQLGWSGVLVEPSPAAFRKLCTLYGAIGASGMSSIKVDNVTLVRAAITTKNGPIDLYDSGTHLNKGDVALLSTTVPSEMDRWKKSGEQFTKTSARGITFETLMKETGLSQFDFISVDCEGADWDVLKQINLDAVGCQMLCIEYNAKKSDETRFTGFVSAFGMKLHWKGYENLIFVK